MIFRPALTLTVNNAQTVLDAGLRAIETARRISTWPSLTAVDSAAVATLLAWQRAARKAGSRWLSKILFQSA